MLSVFLRQRFQEEDSEEHSSIRCAHLHALLRGRALACCLCFLLPGGLGPDVYQLFVKGHGVFCNPASDGAPAKLRLAFEVAPIAFIVEAAGGRSSNGKRSALDVVGSGSCSHGFISSLRYSAAE